jgi:2-oxo-4-hydroxy-4-carboxy--5-ureidoimidazoline (OHCU) decarboxylase
VTDSSDGPSPARAWSTALHLRQQLAATAASIAETEDWVADTLDYLARVRPHDADRLHARAAHARLFAARERAQAAVYRSHPDIIPADGKAIP